MNEGRFFMSFTQRIAKCATYQFIQFTVSDFSSSIFLAFLISLANMQILFLTFLLSDVENN